MSKQLDVMEVLARLERALREDGEHNRATIPGMPCVKSNNCICHVFELPWGDYGNWVLCLGNERESYKSAWNVKP